MNDEPDTKMLAFWWYSVAVAAFVACFFIVNARGCLKEQNDFILDRLKYVNKAEKESTP